MFGKQKRIFETRKNEIAERVRKDNLVHAKKMETKLNNLTNVIESKENSAQTIERLTAENTALREENQVANTALHIILRNPSTQYYGPTDSYRLFFEFNADTAHEFFGKELVTREMIQVLLLEIREDSK